MSEQVQKPRAPGGRAEALRRALLAMAAVCGLLSLLLVVVLFANDFAMGSLDIRNSIELQRAREEFDAHRDDEKHARRVEELDLAIRKEHAGRMALARKSKLALMASLAAFFVSVAAALAAQRKLPAPAAAGDRETEKLRENALGRWAVAAITVVAVAGGAAAIMRWVPSPGEGGLAFTSPQGRRGAPPPAPDDGQPPEAGPPSRAEISRNWPYFRGPEGTGVCRFRNVPDDWNEKQNRNILWKVEVPLAGASSPVVWGDRLFLTAATEQDRKVLCYDAKTGACLWARSYTATGANNEIEVLADYIYAAGTPVVDGWHVAAVFANGDVVCFDFAGKELWARNIGDTSKNQYGYSSSLAMHGSSVIVQFDGGEEQHALLALDVRTGKELWRQERDDKSWASPVVIAVPDGTRQIIVCGNPTVSAWEPDTGRIIWWAEVLAGDGDVACSPIIAAGNVIAVCEAPGMAAISPDCRDDAAVNGVAWKLGKDKPEYGSFPEAASPVSDGELIYVHNSTVVICIDARTGKIVYEKETGESASYASPAVAGGKVYFFAGAKTLIVQAGRQFKLLNTCELDERFDASPAFMEGRIFIRGEKHLYCIGEKD